MLIMAFYWREKPNKNLATFLRDTSEILNILPSLVSCGFLLDALLRLRRVSKGVMEIQTRQMVLHVLSYVLIAISGTILTLIVNKRVWTHPVKFYSMYGLIVGLAFFSELPFILIVIRIGSVKKTKMTSDPEELSPKAIHHTPEQIRDDDEMIERCLRADDSEMGADDRSSVSEIQDGGIESSMGSPKF